MNKLLHTPLTVHNVKLANRLVMPPMATGKTPDGTVQDDLLAYYDARSKGGCIGLIVTEHAYISPEGKAHEGQLSVSRDTDIPGLTKLVETIHKNNTDAYGGDLDGRIHLLLDVIRAVREAVGADYLVALRLGASDYTEGGATIDDAVYACKKFEKAGVDLLDISGGFNGFTVKNRKDPGFFSDASSAIREAVHVPVILTGGVTKANEAEALLEEGAADLIGVGRAIFKDADWAKKEMEE